jgi:hypothetical protein
MRYHLSDFIHSFSRIRSYSRLVRASRNAVVIARDVDRRDGRGRDYLADPGLISHNAVAAGAIGLRFGRSRLQNRGDGEAKSPCPQTEVALTWTLCRTQVSSRR